MREREYNKNNKSSKSDLVLSFKSLLFHAELLFSVLFRQFNSKIIFSSQAKKKSKIPLYV